MTEECFNEFIVLVVFSSKNDEIPLCIVFKYNLQRHVKKHFFSILKYMNTLWIISTNRNLKYRNISQFKFWTRTNIFNYQFFLINFNSQEIVWKQQTRYGHIVIFNKPDHQAFSRFSGGLLRSIPLTNKNLFNYIIFFNSATDLLGSFLPIPIFFPLIGSLVSPSFQLNLNSVVFLLITPNQFVLSDKTLFPSMLFTSTVLIRLLSDL